MAGVATTRLWPVRCVIDHLHRDRAVADAARAGRFTIAGQTAMLGSAPDWLGAALPEDEEWRIEWTKFYFGLDLSHAYADTGDEGYRDAWTSLVGSYVAQVPVGADSSDVAARRVQNWIYAWQILAAAGGPDVLPEAFVDDLVDRIGAQAGHIRDHLTPERNHRTLELYALLVVALALPELDPDGALREMAVAELHANLLADIRPDGVHREHSTHYHLIALRSFLGARENLALRGIPMPDGYDVRLSAACDFALHCHRPDGAIPALSDSDGGSYADVLRLGADALGRDDLRWAASAGAEGRPPAARLAAFGDGGYWTQRSGWGTDRPYAQERFLIFDCGPVGDGGHGHYDLLAFEAAAGGAPLVVDPGRFTYAEGEPNWRRWFKGTAAHNTVAVDGTDQVPYRRGKPRKGTLPEARFLDRLSAPGLDVLDGTARTAVYEALHRRQIAFVADEWWLVVDVLRGERPHRYDLRLHLDAGAQGRTRVGGEPGRWVVEAPDVALVSLGDARPELEEGWVAPSYGTRHPAPVVSIGVSAAGVNFATLVVPRAPGEAAPEATFVQDVDGWTLEVADGAVRDTVMWRAVEAELPLGPLDGAGRTGWLRTRDGDPEAGAIADGAGGWRAWTRVMGTTSGTGWR